MEIKVPTWDELGSSDDGNDVKHDDTLLVTWVMMRLNMITKLDIILIQAV